MTSSPRMTHRRDQTVDRPRLGDEQQPGTGRLPTSRDVSAGRTARPRRAD